MASRLPRLLLLPLLAASAGGAVAQDGDITIYRCTDASGHLTVQDAPCASGQEQQARRMIQPTDPPPRAEPVVPAALEPAPEPPPPDVARHAPKPMYECIRDDGSRYTSDDGEGNPRWVAGGWGWWQPAGPRRGNRGTGHAGGGGGGGGASSGTTAPPPPSTGGSSGGNGPPQLRFRSAETTPPPPPPAHGHRNPGHNYGSGGAWVRDECHVLPQAETCSVLRDRREEIRHRRFNAQANERETLNVEERGISARLSEDCGGA
ncbi:MAG TPA: DUF4124 domain-containing protein [Luteimonas sp.]|nr:DUF4124 domain-containing protein [Luteimonas sp.]